MRVCVSVSNDVFSDNRVKKTCQSLGNYGFEVHLLCKKAKDKTQENNFIRHDTVFLFKKNFLYYAELNIKFFCKALWQKSNLLWANDLDTLLPMFLVSRIKGIPLIFDSHEMFTEVAELKDGSIQKKFWKFLEKLIVPKLKYITTVCNPIKDYFKDNYGVKSSIIRNIPPYSEANQARKHYPLQEKYIVWQGSVNIDRSLEELVLAMKEIDCPLYILGKGDIVHNLEKMIKEQGLENKVLMLGRKSFEEMMTITRNATLGISLDKPTNRNYAISLPNKIFEYINAGTPVLATPLQEIKPIIETYKTGVLMEDCKPTKENIALKINEIINNNILLQSLSDNCLKAQKELSWQNEEKVLYALLDKILNKERKN